MTKNTIRQATLADVPQMADVFAAGFIDDDVFGRFMHPKRREFPEDWLQYWKTEIRSTILDPAGLCFVGVNTEDVVKACCLMEKLGNVSPRLAGAIPKTNQSIGTTSTTDDSTFNNRAADPQSLAIFEKNWNDIEYHFSGARGQAWVVERLCVHPDVQRSGGFGSDLILNAIELGKQEEPPVPVAVISSDVADRFYERYGFREVGRADVGAMSVVKGGSLKFYEEHLRK